MSRMESLSIDTACESTFLTRGVTIGARVGIQIAFLNCSQALIHLLMHGGENGVQSV